MLTASELHARGVVASNQGRHAQARTLLHRALDRADDDDTRARALLSLAHVDSELGSRDQGLARCDEALRIAGISPEVRGLVHSQRGLLLMRSGAGDDALVAFDEALRQLGSDPEPLVRVHLNRGNVHLQRGASGPAQRDFERAAAYAGDAGLTVSRARAQHNLGYTCLLRGDLVAALRLMEQARPVVAPLSVVSKAVCEQDRAEALVASGMTTDAATALRAAAAAFGARSLRQQQAEAELVLARVLLFDSPRDAVKVARRAARRFRSRGSEVWALRAEALALRAEGGAPRPPSDAAARATTLAAALRRHGLSHDARELELLAVRAVVKAGDLDAGRRRLTSFGVSTSLPLPTRLLHREVRAEVAAAGGRTRDAMQHVRRGLADLHSWQSSFGSLDLQSSLVGHGRQLALQGLALAIENGRPEVVFEWSERARALASRVMPVRPPVDPAAAEHLAELRGLHGEIAAAKTAGGMAPAAMVRRSTDLAALVRQRRWYDAGSGVVTEPADMEDVAGALASAGGALAAYLVVNDRLHVLVVAGGRAEVHDLGRFGPVRALMEGMQADLDVAAAHLPAELRAPVQAALADRLSSLAARLVAPLEGAIGDGPVAVVPSGALAGVPWTLLSGFSGRPLTVPRSASSWLTSRAGHMTGGRAGFVAGPRVPRAEEEVERAAKTCAGATVLSGDQARAPAVAELASNVDVFHVAAHGRHSADNPLFSGLELVDGPWFGYDIDQLAAIPSTVILSACELGRSSVRWGEETIGMTVAWLNAGATCVIASPASVDDDVACFVLAATHHHIAAGATASEALALATRDVGGVVPAPFLCFGSGW